MIIIIGAGITGLAAAFELTERGVPFVVLEASDRAGGLILTEKIDGFTIEAGPDSLLAQKRAGIELCNELGLGPRLISTTPPRRAYIYYNRRLHPIPSPSVLGIPTTWQGVAQYDLLPPIARLRLALEPFVARAAPDLDRNADESVAAFFRRRFGRSAADLIAAPLLAGIHAGDIEALSMQALFPRLVEAESGRRGVLLSLRRTNPAVADGAFRSLASGMGELVREIERRTEGRIRLNMKATGVYRETHAWRVECPTEALRGRAVLIAAPAHAAARLLASADATAGDLCAQVPYVSTASVALAWPRGEVPHALAGSGFVVVREAPEGSPAEPGGRAQTRGGGAPRAQEMTALRAGEAAPRITACTWVSSKWDGRAPAGWALLRAFVGGAKDPDAISLPDEELIQIATRDISEALGIRTPARLARVYRWHNAGAQHNVGHLARVDQIERRLSQLPGLAVAGSGFRATGIPDCIADGRAAAAALAHYIAGSV